MGPRTDEINEVASEAAHEAVEEAVENLGIGQRNPVTMWSTAVATVLAAATGLVLGLVNQCNPEPKAQTTYKTLQAAVLRLSQDIKAVETRMLKVLAEREKAASDQAKTYIDSKVDNVRDFTAAFLAGQASINGSRSGARETSESTKKLLELLAKKSEEINRAKAVAVKAAKPMPTSKSPIRKLPSLDKAQQTKGKMAF